MDYAKSRPIKYDYIYILTDMQFTRMIWDNPDMMFNTENWIPYNDIIQESQIIYVNLGGYSNTLRHPAHQNVMELSGISERTLSYFEIMNNLGSLVEYIEQYKKEKN